MTNELTLRTSKGDLDLFGNENIVQTSSIFNLSDISSRYGDYSNEFQLPLTSNNVYIIGNAQYLSALNPAPFQNILCEILVDGLIFKNGFLEITSVKDVISAKFYTGNAVFANIIKNQNISDYDWSSYNHLWSLANAVSASSNSEGYTYAVMNYGAQTETIYLNIKKVLPQTFFKTVMEKIITSNGYTFDYQFNTDEYASGLIPFTNKNPTYPTDYIDANSTDGSYNIDYGVSVPFTVNYTKGEGAGPGSGRTYIYREIFQRIKLNTFVNNGPWNVSADEFITNVAGLYNFSLFIELDDFYPYAFSGITTGDFNGLSGIPTMYGANTEVRFVRNRGGIETTVYAVNIDTATTVSDSVYLEVGDRLYISVISYGNLTYETIGGVEGSFNLDTTPVIKDNNSLQITLDSGLIYGGLITYSTMLPKMKSSEFFKDVCIRFGLLVNIDEFEKNVSFRRFSEVKDNIPNAVDLTDSLDETDEKEIKFSYDTYSQNNFFNHKEDKSIINLPIGSDFNLAINNSNLDKSRVLYTSPFAASETDSFIYLKPSIFINIYDDVKGEFSNDVQPRICFSRVVTDSFYFTDQDGTGGSPVLLTSFRLCYFLDYDQPFNMGFGNNLMVRNSQALIDILQNLRVVKAKFNINNIFIRNLNFFYPVRVGQWDSYFFVSSINQFNYTNKGLTEIELIKLN